MATKTSRDTIGKKREERSNTSEYPRFNMQEGSKEKEVFYIKLLPRLKKSELNIEEPFCEYFQHFNCGPDGDQNPVCMNVTVEEKKKNGAKCAQCAQCRKILRNQDEYKDREVDEAKGKTSRSRANWPVYNLDKRSTVEMMEISGGGLDDILEEFGEDEDYEDLTDLENDAALQIIRKNSGRNSSYKRKAVFGKKYRLDKEDLKNIKDTYITPESVVKNISKDAMAEIVSGEFDVETTEVEERGRGRNRSSREDDTNISDMDNMDKGDEEKTSSRRRSRESEKEDEKEEKPSSRKRSREFEDDDPPKEKTSRRRSREAEKEDDDPKPERSRRRSKEPDEDEGKSERSSGRRKSAGSNEDEDNLIKELEDM